MSYRARLLSYVSMLLVLLPMTVGLSFEAARGVIDAGVHEHLSYAAQGKQDALSAEREELRHYTELVASDAWLQRYLAETPRASERSMEVDVANRFALLAVDCRLLMSGGKQILLDAGCPGLAAEVRARPSSAETAHFSYPSPRGLITVALRSLPLDGRDAATVAVARVMDQRWLSRHERDSEDYLLFFEKDGAVLWSSNPRFAGMEIDAAAAVARKEADVFHLRQVDFESPQPGLPRLWVAISRNRLIALLARSERWAYGLTLAGACAVMLGGWLMLRNFERPFRQLMHTTGEMMKGELPVISRSVSGTEMDLLVNRFADVLDILRRKQIELREVHRQLQETAITDSLTHLYNRRYLQEVSPALFARAQRDGRYLTAVLMDLDHFKEINDRYGHLGGDAVLVHFSRLLRHNCRASDLLFRVGGEEFLILNVTDDPEASGTLADKLRVLVERLPAAYRGVEIQISVSAGISCCSGDAGGALSQLMRRADEALYDAKAGGRNRVVLHASCHAAVSSARSAGRSA